MAKLKPLNIYPVGSSVFALNQFDPIEMLVQRVKIDEFGVTYDLKENSQDARAWTVTVADHGVFASRKAIVEFLKDRANDIEIEDGLIE